jgi:putative membrane protein
MVFDADDPAIRASPAATATAPSGEAATDAPAARAAAPDMPALERGLRWVTLMFGAFLALAFLAFGLWFARFTSVALLRDDWIGLVANGLLIVGTAAGAMLILKELVGFFRLARLGRLRREAERARAMGSREDETSAVRRLVRLMRARPGSKADVARFRAGERHQSEPGALLAFADRELLAGADREARAVVYDSARRVGVVTAVVPVAFLVVLFVTLENIRMVRRLATAYGGRPGFIGGLRLIWRVVAHIAATGAVALTDDLFGQFLGQDIVRRLSRKAGEGAFTGLLTARLGVAAVEVCRPLPWIAATPLRARDIVRELFPEIRPGELVSRAFRPRGRTGEGS